MLVSMRLLKEIIPFEYTAKDLGDELSLLGLEVEGIENTKHKFENIITAKVSGLARIEGTKLFQLRAFTGNNKFQIVTAATNLHDGDVVPLSVPHSILADGTEILPRKLQGVLSNGMLCSYKELGIDSELLSSDEKEGILVFPVDTPIGMPIEKALPIDDEFLELSLLPDRADAFYLVGVARWIETLKARKENRRADFSRFRIDANIELNGKTEIPVVVEAKELAPFYSGRVIGNVVVKKSSYSLRKKLFMLRSRPVNNIVDVTNFILKFYGQPLHSFDADKLKEKVIIRNARKGEKLKTLDGVERILNKWNLVIADKDKAIALAGVMGGEETEVTFDTTNVFLESAYFLPSCISKSSRSLNLITDASMLFEKGTDPEFPEKASLFASKLIIEEAGGNAMNSNVFSNLSQQKPVNVRVERIGKLLGEVVDKESVKKYFDFEGFNYTYKENSFDVKAPSFRRDINIEEDLIEEVLRMKGYNSFGEKPIINALKSAKRTDEEEFLWNLKNKLIINGLMEVRTVSLIGKNLIIKSSLPLEDVASVVNPFSEEISILRPSLFPVMMNVAEINKKNGISDIAIFEVGKIFSYNNETYTEKNSVGILLSGNSVSVNPFKRILPYDFYYLKGIMEKIFCYVGAKAVFKQEQFKFLHFYQSAGIYMNKNRVGLIGTVNPDVLMNFDVKQPVFYAEIDFEELLKNKKRKHKFEEYPLYPPLKMDIAIVVGKEIPEKKVREAILSVAPKELKDITLFDIYEGKPLSKNEKNLAYSLTFYSKERTLKRENIDKFIKKLEESVEEKVEGKLRKK